MASSENALAVRPTEAMSITAEQRKLAMETIAKGLLPAEFELFLYDCKRQGIHPLDRLLIPVIRKDDGERKLTLVTTVDLLRSRAADSDEYAGNDDPIFSYYDDGKTEVVDTATVTVYRFLQGQRCPFTATARWDEYYPGDKQGFMWRAKPHVMLGKCAEALALRKAFPKQLAGMYVAEEMERDETRTIEADKPIVQTKAKATQTATAKPATTLSNPQSTSESGFITPDQLKYFCTVQSKCAIKDEALKEFMTAKLGIGSRKMIPRSPANTYSIFEMLLDWMDPTFDHHKDEWPVKELGAKREF